MNIEAQIAQRATLQPIGAIAQRLGLDRYEPYGAHKAKIDPQWAFSLPSRRGKLVLVTAINPTPAGEGKTTVTIGLSDALNRLGKPTLVALREPSLGPVFGIKGGAAGGGQAQVVPMEDINLHFTGDFHAVTSANNLLAALIDNHIFHGNALNIDPKRVSWRRVMDMNDRQLRQIMGGLGKPSDGVIRPDGFDITSASEIMAILGLSRDLDDLKARLGNILIGHSRSGAPIYARDLKAAGAMAVLLREALKPNLVQTLEGNPALIHTGPFANIAHGCNSLLATKLALHLGDIAVTEAGFGADLGAEKFCDIKCRLGDLRPDAAVLVATVRALKYNGGQPRDYLTTPDVAALAAGLPNLLKHIDNLQTVFGLPVVVAINRFRSDSAEELALIERACAERGVAVSLCEVWEHGGAGGEDLARKVIEALAQPARFRFAYEGSASLPEKITAVAGKIYGAAGVDFSGEALAELAELEKLGLGGLPICMAKTQYSLSDNPQLLGRPEGFRLQVRGLVPLTGAGFIVVLCGTMMRMPGLPKVPAAEHMDIDAAGRISGLF